MLFFLFKVTGIPATEAQALASRGDDYRDYQRTTSAFVPWFPKIGRGTGGHGDRRPGTPAMSLPGRAAPARASSL